VNLTARLAELAVAGEILASEDMQAAIAGTAFRCEKAGRRMVRGFDAPVPVLSVARA
jgi:class 3 adenylate cyclase